MIVSGGAKIPAWLRWNRARGVILLGVAMAIVWPLQHRALQRPRLISYELEPGDECTDSVVAQQLPNWSGTIPLREALQAQDAPKNATAADNQQASDLSERKPERMIRDPYAAYS